MARKLSPFTVRLLSRIMLMVVFLFSVLLALLLLPVILFVICFIGLSILAIYFIRRLSSKKNPPSEYYDIEIYPLTDADLEESLDELQKTSKGKKIERD